MQIKLREKANLKAFSSTQDTLAEHNNANRFLKSTRTKTKPWQWI